MKSSESGPDDVLAFIVLVILAIGVLAAVAMLAAAAVFLWRAVLA